MTQYSTDFADSDHVPNYEPPDWTPRWHGDDSGAPSVISIENDSTGSSFGEQILFQDQVGSTQDCAFSWDDVGAVADADVLMRLRWPGVSANYYYSGPVVRGDEDSSGEIGYVLRVNKSTGIMSVWSFPGPTQIASVYLLPPIVHDVQKDYTANEQWHWVRFQVRGTAIKARIWLDGDAEPSAWDIDITDSSITDAGWVGLHSRSKDCEVDWMGVGTVLDDAPAPPASEGIAQVTQQAIEVLREGAPQARVTQIAVEVLRQNRRHHGGGVIIIG